MDGQAIINIVQNLGAMGILALMVWRAPAIIAQGQSLIQLVIENLRATQTQSLDVFKAEIDKILNLISGRFESVESTMNRSIDNQTEMISEVKTLANRVGALESAKQVVANELANRVQALERGVTHAKSTNADAG